jgi:hypothetical protein
LPIKPDDDLPTPTVITITGNKAFGGAYNDEWHLMDREYNDRPQWHRKGNDKDYIRWDGQRWELTHAKGKHATYVNDKDSPLPPNRGWRIDLWGGKDEPPTLDYDRIEMNHYIVYKVDCT